MSRGERAVAEEFKPGEGPLTVKELIKLLQQCDPERYVYHEGCDCTGDAWSLELDRGRVLITRSDWRPGERGTITVNRKVP